MMEIPMLENGTMHASCVRCVSRKILDGKQYCDENRLEKKPIFCPMKNNTSDSAQKARILLAQKLREIKNRGAV